MEERCGGGHPYGTPAQAPTGCRNPRKHLARPNDRPLLLNRRLRSPGPAPLGEKEKTIMIYQLRIYEIFEHNKAAFHGRFRDHAARIMRKYGFNIVAVWGAQTDRRTEFAYLLVWPDEAAKSAAWAAFMADAEWTEIK